MKVLLKGKRINIRVLKKTDAPAIYESAKDFAVAKYTLVPHPYSLKTALDFVKFTHKQKDYHLGIELKASKKIVGAIALSHINKFNKNAEIGYWLGKKYWGQGIMSEAINLMLKFGFKKLGLVRIYARVMHPNKPSAHLLEKCGFKYEGRLRKATIRRKRFYDHLVYSILKDEYKA